jgi:hypothetical protein
MKHLKSEPSLQLSTQKVKLSVTQPDAVPLGKRYRVESLHFKDQVTWTLTSSDSVTSPLSNLLVIVTAKWMLSHLNLAYELD